MAGRSFKNKYSIRATTSYDCIMACNIVLQDIHSTKHVYDLYKIIRMWHAKGRKGLYVEVVVILTKKPILETTSTYASPYSLSVESL